MLTSFILDLNVLCVYSNAVPNRRLYACFTTEYIYSNRKTVKNIAKHGRPYNEEQQRCLIVSEFLATLKHTAHREKKETIEPTHSYALDHHDLPFTNQTMVLWVW